MNRRRRAAPSRDALPVIVPAIGSGGAARGPRGLTQGDVC